MMDIGIVKYVGIAALMGLSSSAMGQIEYMVFKEKIETEKPTGDKLAEYKALMTKGAKKFMELFEGKTEAEKNQIIEDLEKKYLDMTQDEKDQFAHEILQAVREAETTVSLGEIIAANKEKSRVSSTQTAPEVSPEEIEPDPQNLNNAHPALVEFFDNNRMVGETQFENNLSYWRLTPSHSTLADGIDKAYRDSRVGSQGVTRYEWFAGLGEPYGITYEQFNSIGKTRAQIRQQSGTEAGVDAEKEYEVPKPLFKERNAKHVEDGERVNLRKKSNAKKTYIIAPEHGSMTVDGMYLDNQIIKFPIRTVDVEGRRIGQAGNFVFVGYDHQGNETVTVKVNSARSSVQWQNRQENRNQQIDGAGAFEDIMNENWRGAVKKVVGGAIGWWQQNKQEWEQANPVQRVIDFDGSIGIEGRSESITPIDRDLGHGSIDKKSDNLNDAPETDSKWRDYLEDRNSKAIDSKGIV